MLFEYELPWTTDPTALLWPLCFSPFCPRLTPVERLNAHARLTILLGVSALILLRKASSEARVLVVFWTLLLLVNQGVEFVRGSGETSLSPYTHANAAGYVYTPPAAAVVAAQEPAPAPTRIPKPLPPNAPLWLRWKHQFGSGDGDDGIF